MHNCCKGKGVCLQECVDDPGEKSRWVLDPSVICHHQDIVCKFQETDLFSPTKLCICLKHDKMKRG